MAKQSAEQKAIVGRVMDEFKHGELESTGGKVRNPRQAIAIGLREAGASNRETAERNRRSLARTRTEGGSTEEPTRRDRYDQAARRNIPGRSQMTKDQLREALGR